MKMMLEEVTAILRGGKSNDIAAEAERIIRSASSLKAVEQEGEAGTLRTMVERRGAARAMAERRAKGEPLAYITGYETFMGIELIADKGALVPRKETEPLGNEAIKVLRSSALDAPRVIDMCCGSGNLACAIAHYHPAARVWASDLTDGCITVARRNVENLGVSDRVAVVQGDLFAGLEGCELEGTIDVIVCGPPFISHHKLATESAELLEYEPREAFDGGPYGLSIQQRIVKESLPFLRPGGILIFETGLGQERPAKMLFERAKAYEDIRLIANDEGEVRVISARKRAE